MNSIQQAADKYAANWHIEHEKEAIISEYTHYVTHFLEHLKQQGDDELAELSLKSHNYGQHDLADDIFLEAFKQALAIGRMQGQHK